MAPSENDLDYRELNICFSLYIEVYFWWCENHTDLCHFFQDASRHRFHFHSTIIKAHVYRRENLQLVSKIHKGHGVSSHLIGVYESELNRLRKVLNFFLTKPNSQNVLPMQYWAWLTWVIPLLCQHHNDKWFKEETTQLWNADVAQSR